MIDRVCSIYTVWHALGNRMRMYKKCPQQYEVFDLVPVGRAVWRRVGGTALM